MKRETLLRLTRALGAGLLGLLTVGPVPAAPMPHRAPDQTVGTVNCANSTCHGAMNPWEGNVLRNEYTTWSRLDRHTRAYAVLRNDTSRRIVRNLGLKQAATEAGICLDCHAHHPAPRLRGERFDITEGIGCEGCHGPAGRWVGSHSGKDTPHADNLALGLYPTDDPVAQATLCLSCHFGDETRSVNHHVMGAGHPRISFDLATFTSLQPAHFRVDEDYLRRKGSHDGVRLWAVGQVLAARQLLDTLADPVRGRDGMFPELTLFDCHSCHHPMSAQRWKARMGIGSGRMRLNDSNLLMVRAVVRVVDPQGFEAFNAQVRATHAAVSSGRSAAGGDPLDEVKALSRSLGTYLPRVAGRGYDAGAQRALLLALVDEVLAGDYGDYAGAEQAYMGITGVANDLIARGALAASPAIRQSMRELLEGLAHDESYDALAFARGIGQLRAAIEQQVKS